ncbi:MAG TPA: metallophosphoesterase [Myxococcales bacterium]|nr:metallophosphoesterase [Myxococcales bacterium]
MDRTNDRFLPLLAACAAAAALSFGASCSSNTTKGCVTNADCAIGQVCNKGLCYIEKTTSAGSASAGGTSTGGHAAGTSNGGVGSNGGQTAGNNGSNTGGNGQAASSGGQGGSSTGNPTGWTNGGTGSQSNGGSGSAGTGGSGCWCSSTCCSQDEVNAAPGNACYPSGKICYGTDSDGGAFYCNYQTGKCDPFDPCSGASGTWSCDGGVTTTGGTSTGGAVTIDPTGMSFVATGDTRPDSSGQPYPQQIVNQIYTDFGALSPKPMAVIATGDFQEEGDSNPTQEIDDYEAAINLFNPSTTYPAMGNHECVSTSITTYCGAGSSNNTSAYSAYLQMLVDLGINSSTSGLPYYYRTLTAPNGDTAKFVILAAQAWDSAQVTWLNTTLSTVPTTFTFIARHEPDDAVGCSDSTANDNTTNSCPFIADVQTAINSNPGKVTMLVEGHTHEMRFSVSTDEIVSGGGGVAVESGCTASDDLYCGWGYVYCQERTDKSMICNMYDYQSGSVTGMTYPGATGSYTTYSAVTVTPAGVMSYAN